MLEFQTILELSVPSSGSDALPLKMMAIFAMKLDVVTGELIVTVGGVFGLVMVNRIEALAVAPAESVTVAVTVCAPAVKLVVEKLAPVPI